MRKLRTEQRGRQENSPASESKGPAVRFDRRLLTGLDEQGVADLHARWNNSRHIRELLARALTKSLDSAILQSESSEVLASPNALAVLSDLNGYRRACREAIRLLTNQDEQ